MIIKTFQSITLTFVLIIAISSVASAADRYKIDGNLSDWNVTPFYHWEPNSSSAKYTVEDYNGTKIKDSDGSPYGGELYDIEALYFDADNPGPYAYFAIVTSYYNTTDLAIDINPDDGYNYEYGISLAKKIDMTKGANYGNIYYKPQWTDIDTPYNTSHQYANPYRMREGTGTLMGRVDVTEAVIGPDPYEAITRPDRVNYIIEGKIPRSYLGSPKQDEISKIHITMYCGNDRIEIGSFRWTSEIPEFPALAFPVASIIGIVYIFNRKKSK